MAWGTGRHPCIRHPICRAQAQSAAWQSAVALGSLIGAVSASLRNPRTLLNSVKRRHRITSKDLGEWNKSLKRWNVYYSNTTTSIIFYGSGNVSHQGRTAR
jgi:hypothetical protein